MTLNTQILWHYQFGYFFRAKPVWFLAKILKDLKTVAT